MPSSQAEIFIRRSSILKVVLCDHPGGQVLIQVHIQRSGDMFVQIVAFPLLGLGKIETAIENCPIEVIQVLGEFIAVN